MENKGHENLLEDVRELLRMVESYEFHDFKTNRATPKIDLYNYLEAMLEKIKSGDYDE